MGIDPDELVENPIVYVVPVAPAALELSATEGFVSEEAPAGATPIPTMPY